MNPFVQIKNYRKQSGLSQQALAAKAGISLATVQNIESGRSNPEWSTLVSLFEILGLRFDLQPQSIDWNRLAAYGCPLMQQDVVHEEDLTRKGLIGLLNQPGLYTDHISMETREEASLHALLFAIREHYPSIWKQLGASVRNWFSNRSTTVSNKLRRIALQRLGTYL